MVGAAFLTLFLIVFISGCGEETRLTTRSQEAATAYQEAVALWEKFYYAEARKEVERALSLDSTFSMAWARLAMLDGASRNEADARANIEKAVHYAQGATRREQLFVNMWRKRIFYAFKDAAQTADSLILLYPDEKEAYLFRGQLYEMSKDLDAALEAYHKAVQIDTGYALGVMSLGYAYSAAGQHERALSNMERYIRMAPDAADPRASYADLLLRVGRYDEALEQYRQSLQLKPDYWYAINQIGSIYMIQGRLEEAARQFDEGLRMLFQNGQLEASLLRHNAVLNRLRGNYEAALEGYRKSLLIDSTDLSAGYGSVAALGKLQRFEDAERFVGRIRDELVRRELSESGVMQGFFLMRAQLLTEQDRLEEALQACDSALEHSSPLGRGSVYRQIAEIRLKQKDYEAAFDACEEALRANPNAPSALLTLTRIYHAKRDRIMTREIGNRLLSLWKDADPDFQDAREVRRLLGIPS